MGNRLVPNNVGEFLTKAESLARTIAANPQRYGIPDEDVQAMQAAATRFRAAFNAAFHGDGSRAIREEKRQAHAQAKKQFVRCVNLVRLNEAADAVARFEVGIKDRPARTKSRTCPMESPRLRFLRAVHEGNSTSPVHELVFEAMDHSAKPEGAVRLELFIDMIPPDEPIPSHPGANHGSRPWYLRSYTRSPIRIIPPMAHVPMRVVYWGRWADSTGNVGPFSATAAGWVEGGSISRVNLQDQKSNPIKSLAEKLGQVDRDPAYRVAVLEMRYQSYLPQQIVSHELPAPEQNEPRQLEGPAQSGCNGEIEEMIQSSAA